MFEVVNNIHTDIEKVVNRCIGNTTTGMIINAVQSHIRQTKRAGANPTLDERNTEDEANREYQDESTDQETGKVLNPLLTRDEYMAIQNGQAARRQPLEIAGLLTSIREAMLERQQAILINPDKDGSLDAQYRLMSFKDLIEWQINNPRDINNETIQLRANILGKLSKNGDNPESQKRNIKLLTKAAEQQNIQNQVVLQEMKGEILNIAENLEPSHDAENAFRGLPTQLKIRLCVGVMNRLLKHRDQIISRFMRTSNPKIMLSIGTEMELVEDVHKQLHWWLDTFTDVRKNEIYELELAGISLPIPNPLVQ